MFRTFVAALVGLSLSAAVNAQGLVEGKDYTVLDPAVATQVEDDQIEVTEVFWFGCPHCNHLQPIVNEWYDTLDDDVAIVKMPATMGGTWNTHAVAFYAAQELGIEEDLHADFFDAIHQQGRSMTSEDELAEFFSEYGVSEEEAKQALNSFNVRSKVNQAHGRMREMQLMGVPDLVIDGRFVVSPSSAGSIENMTNVADQLVDKVRSERAN